MSDYKKDRFNLWACNGPHYVVTQVAAPTEKGHIKHSVGSVTDTGREGDEKKRKYFQFWSYASADREARSYPVGTVLEIYEKNRSGFQSTTNADTEYITLDECSVRVLFPAGMMRKILAESDNQEHPATYNKKPAVADDDLDEEYAF